MKPSIGNHHIRWTGYPDHGADMLQTLEQDYPGYHLMAANAECRECKNWYTESLITTSTLIIPTEIDIVATSLCRTCMTTYTWRATRKPSLWTRLKARIGFPTIDIINTGKPDPGAWQCLQPFQNIT